ncbi:hypothetical protein DIC66_17635 [Rhodoferax lacus]|uniref:DUF2726 domain-containing protein n=1 Tax=Rhodoferax lacus TaxID=2184758 RepID=A0A3E1R8C3_9BURK|nr:DUF2726 domain-containing protein [Rhodoferax lacus]RFO95619.1 hypothetical protein DIC66_17635 [Rhodoferax lacus]
MNHFVTLALLLLCAALVIHLSQRRNAWRKSDTTWPFYGKRPLSTPEQVLYQRLVTALPGHIVLSRVPLSSVLGVRPGFDLRTWSRRLRHLQYDYVVCARDVSVLAAIELEDSARSGKAPTAAEETKERATATAGIPLLRWQVGALPDQAQIQAAFGRTMAQGFADADFNADPFG